MEICDRVDVRQGDSLHRTRGRQVAAAIREPCALHSPGRAVVQSRLPLPQGWSFGDLIEPQRSES
jgi:hypothetical protein